MYYLVFVYLMGLVLLQKKIEEKKLLLLSVIPLIIIVIFRYGVGADYFSYEFMYMNLKLKPINYIFTQDFSFEPLFGLVMYISSFAGIPYHVFLSILNIAMLYFLYKWIIDNSKNVLLSILLFYSMFYFVWILSALRQGLVLFIGLYYLLNEKVHLSKNKRFVLIILLSLIHTSALFYFVIELIKNIKWNKKRHLIFLLIALAATLVPIEIFLNPLSNISLFQKVLVYISNRKLGFFDFSSLIRLLLYFGIFAFYDLSSGFNRKFYNLILAGFSVYFLLKFSEITAARITIYTYFLVVIAIPDIITNFKASKEFSIILNVVLITGSFIYLEKELLTLQTQTGLNTENIVVNFTTHYNKDNFKFDTFDYFRTKRNKDALKIEQNFSSESIYDRKMVKYKQEDNYYLVNFKEGKDQLSGVFNQEGKWLLYPQYNPNLTLYGNLLVKRADYGLLGKPQYLDISDQTRSESELEEQIKNHNFKSFKNEYAEEEIVEDFDFKIPKEFEDLFAFPEKINKISMSKIYMPFEYYIVKIDYYHLYTPSYIYLDSEFNVINKVVSEKLSRFSVDGFLEVFSYNQKIVFNKNGDVLWVERIK